MLAKDVVCEESKLVTKQWVTLNVNGRRYKFSVGDGTGDVSPAETLLKPCGSGCS
jgi:hypothetical protein